VILPWVYFQGKSNRRTDVAALAVKAAKAANRPAMKQIQKPSKASPLSN
jgi:hypothetical protein